jgi:hypothetical protein
MMPVALSISGVLLLAIILWRFLRTADLADSEWLSDLALTDSVSSSCPKDIVSTIFRGDDFDFVAKYNSPPLNALLARERKLVASMWVRHTAASVQRVMREHTRISRRSQDLETHTELTIYFDYIRLRLMCTVLLAGISIFGTIRVRHLSLYVYRLSEQISAANAATKTAMQTRELQDAWRT